MEDFDSLRAPRSVPASGRNPPLDQPSSSALTVAEVLRRAADLIEPEGAWTTGAMGRPKDGSRVIGGKSPELLACSCFCASGALAVVAPDQGAWFAALTVLDRVINAPVTFWNDAPERTQAEVVATLREAADLAEREASPVAVTESLQARSGEARGASQ